MTDPNYYSDIIYYITNITFPPNYTERAKAALRKRVTKYELDNETLYFNMGHMKVRIVQSETERMDKIIYHHGNHYDRYGTFRGIRDGDKCYWKNMLADINEYITKRCDWCRENAMVLVENYDNELQVMAAILGPYFPDTQNFKFIGVLVEPRSKWIELAFMKDSGAKTFARFIEVVFFLFKWRPVFFVDMEPQFVRNLDKELVKRGVLFPNKFAEPNSQFGHGIPPTACLQPEGRTHIIDLVSLRDCESTLEEVNEIAHQNVPGIINIEFAKKLMVAYINRFLEEEPLNPAAWQKPIIQAMKMLRQQQVAEPFRNRYAIGNKTYDRLFIANESETESEEEES